MYMISWIYCHNVKEDANPDLPPEVNLDFNLNKVKPSFEPEDIKPTKLTDKEISLSEVNKNAYNDYYNDLSSMSKRNAYAHHRFGKRKQLIKHKNPSEVNMLRTHLVRRKNKGQNKMKLNKIKKDDQETSLYSNNKIPFQNDKSNYNGNHGVDMSYKSSLASNDNNSNKLLVFDKKKEDIVDKDSMTNISDGSYKDNDESYKGNSITTSASENKENIGESEQKDNQYEPKLKRILLNKQTNMEGNEEDTESRNQENKPHTVNVLKPNKFEQHLSETPSLSVNVGTKFEDTKNPVIDISLLSLDNKNHNQENMLHTKSLNNNEFESSKDDTLGRRGKQSKQNEYSSEEGFVLESKEDIIKPLSESGVDETHTSNDKSYSKSEKENTNTTFIEHAKHKTSHNHAQNYHRQHYAHNHMSFQNSNYDFKNVKPKKRSKKNASLKSKRTPTSDSERDYYDNSNREPPMDESNLGLQENINSLKLEKHMSEDIANKRNLRDIKKRLNKHNNYKNHIVEDSNVFGYLKNSDENEDINVGNVQTGPDSYNANDDDSSEYQHRQVDVNSNNNDKYSYKESLEEETGTGAISNVETPNKKYNRKKTFSRQSHEPRQKGDSNAKCVNYKDEKLTKKPTSTTIVKTENCTTKGTTCVTKRTTTKPKTTPQTCNKSLTTNSIEPENGKNNSYNEALDIFDKYLCGQLADNFVDAVMDKVKKSRKIYKELGFRIDSEEACDRCIETKPNKMPDKETVKAAMGKCLKNNERKSSCYMCYSVPRSMEKVLNLLVLFEKEHENSVYNKIRDDSSFIFTGDYPEQFNQNDDSVGNKYKYISDRESFNKDTFDKQDLREDSNDEKHDVQIINESALEDDSTLEADNKNEAHSTESVVDKDESMDKKYDNKLNVQNGIINRDKNYKSKGESSLDLDDKVGETDVNDEFVMTVAPRSKLYSPINELGADKTDDSFDKASIKQRRKAFKSDKFTGPINTYITPNDPETETASNMKRDHLGERNFGLIANVPSKSRYESENLNVIPKERDVFSTYENVRQRHKTPYQYKDRRAYGKNSKLSPLNNYESNEKFSHKRNPFAYPSEDYIDDDEILHPKDNKNSVGNGFISNGWVGGENELMPKQSDVHPSEHNRLSLDPRKRYYNDYEERLNMVKRESEPSYEEEPLFFEIPNIEYDLY